MASLHHVSASGAVELVAANVPYTSLLWTRRLSEPGEFSLKLACDSPVAWPGRYLVTVDGRDEVGIVEKVEGTWDGSDSNAEFSGRFGECLWDRYQLAAGGQTARGANWRQAVTAALRSWHMPDLPPLALGSGTQSSTGSSYRLSGEAGDTASEVIYDCTYANDARPLVGYDRGADRERLSVRIIDGVDRTRDQKANPWCVFSLQMGSAVDVGYSGDYSTSCSVVMAHAEKQNGEDEIVVDRTVKVPGFDNSVQWQARAYEDVASLIDRDEDPTPALVEEVLARHGKNHKAGRSELPVSPQVVDVFLSDLHKRCENLILFKRANVYRRQIEVSIAVIVKSDGQIVQRDVGNALLLGSLEPKLPAGTLRNIEPNVWYSVPFLFD